MLAIKSDIAWIMLLLPIIYLGQLIFIQIKNSLDSKDYSFLGTACVNGMFIIIFLTVAYRQAARPFTDENVKNEAFRQVRDQYPTETWADQGEVIREELRRAEARLAAQGSRGLDIYVVTTAMAVAFFAALVVFALRAVDSPDSINAAILVFLYVIFLAGVGL